jgi:hypothetical protein
MSTEPQRFVCPRCRQRYRSFRTEAEWSRDHLADVCPARSRPGASPRRSPRTAAAPVRHLKRVVDWFWNDWEWFAYLVVGAGCVAAPMTLAAGLPRAALLLLGAPLLVLAGYRLRGETGT